MNAKQTGFTDSEIDLWEAEPGYLGHLQVKALLARLKAAEKIMDSHRDNRCGCARCIQAYELWLRSAGKGD